MTSAREIATTYAHYVAALLLGDDAEAVDFGRWLDRHWHAADDADGCQDDAGGRSAPHLGVVWTEEEDEVVGLLAGRYRGSYRIPIAETPPPIACFLDDAVGCSTGSVLQERAHIRAVPAAVACVAPAPLTGPVPRVALAAVVVPAPAALTAEHAAGGV